MLEVKRPAETEASMLADQNVASGVKSVKSAKRQGGIVSLLRALIIPVIIIAMWEWAGRAEILAGGLFPSASASVMAFLDFVFGIAENPGAYSATWVTQVWTSTGRVLIGFGLGAAIGVILGVLSGYMHTIRDMVDPMINVIRPVAITAWVPIALILFGIGEGPAIFLTALATFFPVYVDTLTGARFAEGNLLKAARMLGANKFQILWRVTLPAALPSIAAGLRVGLSIAWTCVVIAEVLGAKSGVGYVLIDSYNQFRLDYVVACMITLGLFGFLSDKVLSTALDRMLRWKAKGAES